MSEIETGSSDWRGRIYRYAPLILWTGIVLFASTTNGSMTNTSRFMRPILEFLFPNAHEDTLLIYHGYVRKMAHLTEYGILAFWASRALWNSSFKLLKKYWYLSAFLAALMVALVDEYNQSFSLVRTGSINDVMIDVLGAAAIILLLCWFNTSGIRKR